MLNIHHLELFYYVAAFGGIAEAVRHIPYGIQQPAVSGQVLQLEEYLGVTLFQRRPFQLTPAGEKLFRYIKPFFQNLEALADELRGSSQIRIGASEIVLRDHLPEVIANVRKDHPHFVLRLREGYQPQLEAWLQKQEIDLAITLIEGRPLPGVHCKALLELPMILLVNKKRKHINRSEDLWAQGNVREGLVSLPENEAVCKRFQEGLHRLGVSWLPRIEVSSLELISTYVLHDYGIGLSVAVPQAKVPPGIKVLPLETFPKVELGVLWQGKLEGLGKSFFDHIQARAQLVNQSAQKTS